MNLIGPLALFGVLLLLFPVASIGDLATLFPLAVGLWYVPAWLLRPYRRSILRGLVRLRRVRRACVPALAALAEYGKACVEEARSMSIAARVAAPPAEALPRVATPSAPSNAALPVAAPVAPLPEPTAPQATADALAAAERRGKLMAVAAAHKAGLPLAKLIEAVFGPRSSRPDSAYARARRDLEPYLQKPGPVYPPLDAQGRRLPLESAATKTGG